LSNPVNNDAELSLTNKNLIKENPLSALEVSITEATNFQDIQ
jgi:hypothetical protein